MVEAGPGGFTSLPGDARCVTCFGIRVAAVSWQWQLKGHGKKSKKGVNVQRKIWFG